MNFLLILNKKNKIITGHLLFYLWPFHSPPNKHSRRYAQIHVARQFITRKHFPGHTAMAMPDRFWVKLKNQTNFEFT